MACWWFATNGHQTHNGLVTIYGNRWHFREIVTDLWHGSRALVGGRLASIVCIGADTCRHLHTSTTGAPNRNVVKMPPNKPENTFPLIMMGRCSFQQWLKDVLTGCLWVVEIVKHELSSDCLVYTWLTNSIHCLPDQGHPISATVRYLLRQNFSYPPKFTEQIRKYTWHF